MIVGSNYFFNKFEEFKSKDIDYLVIVSNPKYFKFLAEKHDTLNHKCEFIVNGNLTKEELIQFHKDNKCPMTVGKFLIPEFNEYFKITLEDLKELEDLFNNLDKLHLYEQEIYKYYLENNSFTLTDELLNNVYLMYKKYRQ